MKKYTSQQVKEIISSNSSCQLISKYINYHSLLRIKCGCGNEFETTLARFLGQNKRTCDECTKIRIRKLYQKEIDAVNRICLEKGYIVENLCDYKNNLTVLKVKDDFGYSYKTNLSNIQSSQPLPFSIHNPYSLDNIRHYMKKNNHKTKLLSKNYGGDTVDLSFECNCGRKFKRRWADFRRGNGLCLNCAIKKSADEKRHSFVYIKNMFKENGYEILDTCYKNLNTKVNCKDKYGYKYFVHPSVIKYHNKPDAVSSFNPYSIYNIKKYILNHHISSNLISTEYVDIKQSLCFKCKCGKLFYTTWDSFKHANKTRCNYCAKVYSSYELKVAEFLDKYKIDYIKQYPISYKNPKNPFKFDFKINCDNSFAFIEVDGKQHFYAIDAFGGENGLKETQRRDNLKTEYCEKNDIPLLRIPYLSFNDESYKNILENFVNKLEN